LALRGLPSDTLLIVLYVALSRAFIGNEASLGIKIGPVPLFVTDVTLVVLIAMDLHKRGGRFLNWVFGGGGARAIGRAVWLLFLISVVDFALAFPKYRIMAMRDLAIFGYSIFFPVTYFALKERVQASKLVRYSIYATCLGAVFFNLQTLVGVHLFALYENPKGLPGHQAVGHIGGNNLGAALGPGLAGLFAYLAMQREHRLFHAGAMLLCLAALAQIMDRSAFLGFSMAAGLMFILGVGRSRIYLTALAAGLLAVVLVSAQAELPIPGGARLHSFWQSVSSGANYLNDPDAQFRLQRWGKTAAVWMTSPVFGVGFGAPIIADTGGENLRGETKQAIQRGGLGAFNVGMPHNSFLMALARTGLIGLGLICFAWFSGIIRIVRLVMRGVADADQVASAGALIAMISTAALNLFFERPMLCAPFWILLAASYKLSERVPQQINKTLRSTAPPEAVTFSPQHFRYRRRGEPHEHVAGGWQARWQ
jgi:O-antigen ligase